MEFGPDFRYNKASYAFAVEELNEIMPIMPRANESEKEDPVAVAYGAAINGYLMDGPFGYAVDLGIDGPGDLLQ